MAVGAQLPLAAALPQNELVSWLVEGMYVDQVLPRGSLLQWLLQSIAGVHLDAKELRSCIEGTHDIELDPPNARKLRFTAYLKVQPSGFRGFVSEEDVTEDTLGGLLWEESCKLLSRGGWPKPEDVSHKYYVVASWLQDVSAELRALTFGRVLSIVQSGVRVTGVLGHRAGLLVPYALSEECERRVNACLGQPTGLCAGESFVRSWNELRELLSKLLDTMEHDVEVCKLKQEIRAKFQVELSETVFGHQSLTKVLADPELAESGLFDVVGKGNTYSAWQAWGRSSPIREVRSWF
eukprot:TRINITY_DN16473_c0_g1_i7.p1 TRINITY_DN16473_c0_g1~~TRINITY_DN16473_c0_g1_i7.p1  ORF type:complete len:294 (+),score=66.88 TRINITY_DN16473_c0_g1_i7:100-981(+)